MTDQNPAQTEGKPLDFLLSFKGRIDRRQFLAGLLILVGLIFALLFAAASFMDPRGGPGLFIPISIVLLIAVAWVHSALLVKRLRDAGHPAWYWLIFGPGPFALLLFAEQAGPFWFMVALLSLCLLIAPGLFPTKLAEAAT